MMKWLLVLVMVIGLLGCSNIVGPDPQFENEVEMVKYTEGQYRKLLMARDNELKELHELYDGGRKKEVSPLEYKKMVEDIFKKYERLLKLLEMKYYEGF